MTSGTRPNIIVIVSDTLRRDHLGAYGNQAMVTPHLDAFAGEAAVFDHYTVSSFPTMPARADLLTGRFAYTFMGWEPLSSGQITLPTLLASAGYLTMGIVDTPFFIRNGFGYDRGFHDFIWIRGQGDGLRPREREDARRTWLHESDRFVAQTVTRAEEWLERHHDEQFFLYIDTWDPHEPWNAPAYYTKLYLPHYDGREVYPVYTHWKDAGLTEDDVAVAHATYCGEITMVDRWIGRLIEKIDLLGLRENTFVFFLSDHGFYFGEHGLLGKSQWGQENITEENWYSTLGWSPLYQELTRIPLMVRGPGVSVRRNLALATAPDIAPTIIELAGTDPVSNHQGMSLVPMLNGTSDRHREFVVSSWPLSFSQGETTGAVDSVPRRVSRTLPLTISTHQHSVIVGGPDDPPELYDLVEDPQERKNVWPGNSSEGVMLLEAGLEFLTQCDAKASELRPRLDAHATVTANMKPALKSSR